MGIFDEAKKKVQELLDQTDLDEKLVAGVQGVKERVQGLLDRTDTDEIAAGVQSAKEGLSGLLDALDDTERAIQKPIVEGAQELRGQVQDAIDQAKVEEKINTGVQTVQERLQSFVSQFTQPVETKAVDTAVPEERVAAVPTIQVEEPEIPMIEIPPEAEQTTDNPPEDGQ